MTKTPDIHLSPSEAARKLGVSPKALRLYEQNDVTRRWDALIAEAKALMEIGNPESPEALALARRWRSLVAEFTGGDTAILGKLNAVWGEAFADPAAAPKLPFGPELMGFVMKAQAKLKQLETTT